MYRTVNELNESELNELRNSLYWDLVNEGKEIDEEDIKDDMLFEHYDGICFVEDDFFCNQ